MSLYQLTKRKRIFQTKSGTFVRIIEPNEPIFILNEERLKNEDYTIIKLFDFYGNHAEMYIHNGVSHKDIMIPCK